MAGIFEIEGVYVIHAKSGYEYQERRLKAIFEGYGIEAEFVTDGDPSCFTDQTISRYFCPDIKNKLSTGILSCTLNHILVYEKIVKSQQKLALIFENDPYFLGDFLKKIKRVSKEAITLKKGFIVSLENSTLKFPPIRKMRKGKYLYPATQGRCAGAYIIDLEAARNILADLNDHKCCDIIDWWHNRMIAHNVIDMYWSHPPLTEQGSHNGLMGSSISGSGKGLKRRIKWLAQKYYKMYILRWVT